MTNFNRRMFMSLAGISSGARYVPSRFGRTENVCIA